MKRIFVFSVTILLLFAGNTIKAQQIEQYTLPPGAIPIVYRGHLYIQGSADSVQGNFVFDTGASGLYYDTTFYSNNHFDYSKIVNAKLPGAGTTPQDIIVVRDTVGFSFGSYYYQTAFVPVLKLKPILGDFSDGIIGLNYFSKSVLEINYIYEFMKIHSTIDAIDISAYKLVPLKKIDNRLYLPLKVCINDTVMIAGDFMLDFGSGGSVSLTSPIAQKYKLKDVIKEKVFYYTNHGGVGGASSRYVFNAKSFQIGDFVFDNISMDYSLDTSGAMSSKKHLGLFGNRILERFDILIDFKNTNLYLKPNKDLDKEFTFSRLGFSYVDRNKTLGGWIVRGLFKNRNAEKKGLKIDDMIISVNGVAVAEIPYESQKDFFKKLSEVNLVVKRGSSIENIKFKLEPVL